MLLCVHAKYLSVCLYLCGCLLDYGINLSHSISYSLSPFLSPFLCLHSYIHLQKLFTRLNRYIKDVYVDIYNSFHDSPAGKRGKGKRGGVYVQVIAARLRMDMKVAFKEVKDTLHTLFPVKKARSE